MGSEPLETLLNLFDEEKRLYTHSSDKSCHSTKRKSIAIELPSRLMLDNLSLCFGRCSSTTSLFLARTTMVTLSTLHSTGYELQDDLFTNASLVILALRLHQVFSEHLPPDRNNTPEARIYRLRTFHRAVSFERPKDTNVDYSAALARATVALNERKEQLDLLFFPMRRLELLFQQ